MFKRGAKRPRNGDGEVHGVARVDAKTKRLLDRIQAAEIAVIDHNDLDRIAAEGLVEKRVKAVINAAPSSTGRYPNLGPLVLATARVPLIDSCGPELFAKVKEGDYLVVEDDRVLKDGEVIAKGELIDVARASALLDAAKKEIAGALEEFAENTLEYMRDEKEFLIEAIRLPATQVDFAHRHVLVVARGYGYKEDLSSLRRSYIRDFRPVLVGVDGGADALMEVGLKPDIIIGDMDSVTTDTLTSGAELILHAYPDGTAPGKPRLDALGLSYATFQAAGTSEDLALLLAHEKGADLLVVVGARLSVVEFMDKGRKGMASTFLVRLRVGPKLVDAKGVSGLHRSGPTGFQLAGLVLAALASMTAVLIVSPFSDVALDALGLWLERLWFSIGQAFN